MVYTQTGIPDFWLSQDRKEEADDDVPNSSKSDSSECHSDGEFNANEEKN